MWFVVCVFDVWVRVGVYWFWLYFGVLFGLIDFVVVWLVCV